MSQHYNRIVKRDSSMSPFFKSSIFQTLILKSVILPLVILVLANINSFACHGSGISLTGSGVTLDAVDPENDGIPNYTIQINFCVAYGNQATNDTYDVEFSFVGGTLSSVTSFPATIGGGAFGNSGVGTLSNSGTSVSYDSGTESCGNSTCDRPLADLNGNGQVCGVFVFSTNGLPAQIDLFGLEATSTTEGNFPGSQDFCNYYYASADNTPESILIDPNDLSLQPTNTVLPVELVYFRAFYDEEESYNTLEWETASESNNEGFLVQASTDGREFVTIGNVAGAGTTSKAQRYAFYDENPSPITYYRLKQMDHDGAFEFTMIFAVERKVKEEMGVSNIFPNPASEYIFVDFKYNEEQPLNIFLTDRLGRQFVLPFDLSDNMMTGAHSHAPFGGQSLSAARIGFDFRALPKGVYFVTIQNGELFDTKRVTKL